MKEIRLGTIGSGVIVHSVLDGVKVTDGIALTAVYSRTEEKARTLTDKYGEAAIYTDMDAFLADESVNTVYIASPNLLHYEQTKAALEAGKHVICEKPFCTKSSQANELADLARSKNLMLVEAAPTTFLPNFKLLKESLGKIGRIRLVISNYSQYSSRYDLLLKGELPNVFNPEFAGGCLMDINFYNVLLNVALFGRPKEAIYYPNLTKEGIDTSGSVVMIYDDFVSQNAAAKDTWGVNSFQIEGEKGYIYIKDGSNGLVSLDVVTKESKEEINLQDNPDRWFYEIQNLTPIMLAEDMDAINERLEITLAVTEIIESIRKNTGIIFPGDSES